MRYFRTGKRYGGRGEPGDEEDAWMANARGRGRARETEIEREDKRRIQRERQSA